MKINFLIFFISISLISCDKDIIAPVGKGNGPYENIILSDKEFSGLGTITDIEGNVYKTTVIGPKLWMAENLNVSKFNNGDLIANVKDAGTWSNLNSPAWCNYANDDNIGKKVGKLYNWFTVIDARNVCPVNWTVASDEDWTFLTNVFGGDNVAGGALKEFGFNTWASPNSGATNKSLLNIKSNGFRNFESSPFTDSNLFSAYGSYGTFWTSSFFDQNKAWHRYLYWGNEAVNRNSSIKKNGFAIRCVKNIL
jgi:uncharacterized protein (TIGR02145 family)